MKGTLLNSRWAPGNSTYYETYDNGYDINSSTSQRSKPLPPRTHSVPAPPQSRQYSHWSSHSHSHPQSHSHSQSASHSTPLPPAEELSRFMKIISRLRWKLPFLAEAYRLAVTTNTSPSTTPGSSFSEAEAEIMFKIDFFEYYALLERAIVHLLAVFNITVTSSAGARGRAPNHTSHTNGHTNGSSGTLHRYHANVLSALESESSPLTPVLGSGHVFDQLRQAKELRNRWKTADMTGEQDRDRDREGVRPLESYDLEGILGAIFAGLEEGFVRAREHVALCRRVGEDVEDRGREREEGWEFMVDAMDWEAV